MIKLPDTIGTVFLDSVGEVSKQKFTGSFRVKIVLTNADQIAVEREYARLLPKDAGAGDSNKLLASTMAELNVRVLEGPAWFRDASSGQNMIDRDPLYDLIVRINEAYKDWQNRLNESATAGDDNVVQGPAQS